MFIKKYLVAFLAILSLFIFDAGFSVAADSILSTTLRKTSANGLNLTFFTRGDNKEKPIVKDKGNNKYVILLPNLSDSTSSGPDLRMVSDLVSDVDVKTINEGAVTYTKITLTSKKPIVINAETKKTTQSASELSGMNNIISKVNLINEDIQESRNIQPVSMQQPTSQPLPKMSSVQDILNNKAKLGNNIKPAVEVKKEVKPQVTPAPIVISNSVSSHVPSNTSTIKNEAKNLKDENIKNVKKQAVEKINKIENNVKESVANNVDVNSVEVPLEEVSEQELEAQPASVDVAQEKAPSSGLRFGFSDLLNSPFALILLLFILGTAVLAFIAVKVKNSLTSGYDMNESFIEHMNLPIPPKKHDFSGIAQNSDMTWQEKYSSYKTGKTKEQLEELKTHIGVEPDEDLDVVEEFSSQETEHPTETLNIFASGVVSSSDESITKSMKKSLLTGFADDRSLTQTRRNTGLKNRFKSFDSPNVTIERNMSELLDTVIKMEEEKPKVIKTEALSSPQETDESVKEAVAKIVEHASSPIQSAKAPEPVADMKKKMSIKESRLIDDSKGFYLVNMNEQMALMGRIKDKFTVLKRFDGMDKSKLQVRRDKDNLYMVRTDGYKALVNVESDKMGVFAEL